MKAGIAYIDDNKLNLDCIKTILDKDFEVNIFSQPDLFLTKFPANTYVSILLDIHMPAIDGFSLYEKIIEHPEYNGCPVLFISSDNSDSARIKSFLLGAVDFIYRDVSPEEMIARVKSKIQFFQKHRNIIEFTSLRVNLTLLKTYLHNAELPLTFIEFKILCLVLRNYPDYVAKADLVEQVWRTDKVLDATIYTHVSNLNTKLVSWDHQVIGLKGKGIQLTKRDHYL